MDFSQFADQPVMSAWLGAVLAAAPFVSKLLGGITKGRSEGRAQEIDVTQDRDAATLDRARLAEDQAYRQQRTGFDQADLDLKRREYTDKARSTGYGDRAMGGLLQGLQDFSLEGPEGVTIPKISGGLRPSAILNKEQLGRDMERGAITRGLAGENFAPVENVQGPEVPGLSELPKAGKLDSFLNIAGLIASLAGGAGEVASVIRGGGSATSTGGNMASGNAGRIINRSVRF